MAAPPVPPVEAESIGDVEVTQEFDEIVERGFKKQVP
jgi:hypothetical protein